MTFKDFVFFFSSSSSSTSSISSPLPPPPPLHSSSSFSLFSPVRSLVRIWTVHTIVPSLQPAPCPVQCIVRCSETVHKSHTLSGLMSCAVLGDSPHHRTSSLRPAQFDVLCSILRPSTRSHILPSPCSPPGPTSCAVFLETVHTIAHLPSPCPCPVQCLVQTKV